MIRQPLFIIITLSQLTKYTLGPQHLNTSVYTFYLEKKIHNNTQQKKIKKR